MWAWLWQCGQSREREICPRCAYPTCKRELGVGLRCFSQTQRIIRKGSWCQLNQLRVFLFALVLQWVQTRRLQGAGDRDLLFVKPRGGATDSAYWSDAVRAAVTEAQQRGWLEQGGKWSSRSLRSGGAARMQALGYGEAAIMALGGWLSKAMQYYLRKTHLTVENLSTRMFHSP